jgi:hypothetical protein
MTDGFNLYEDMSRPFRVEPNAQGMEHLIGYKPTSVEHLSEWLMMAARNVCDEKGLRVIFRFGVDCPVGNTPLATEMIIAWQLARMMQLAGLIKLEQTEPSDD